MVRCPRPIGMVWRLHGSQGPLPCFRGAPTRPEEGVEAMTTERPAVHEAPPGFDAATSRA